MKSWSLDQLFTRIKLNSLWWLKANKPNYIHFLILIIGGLIRPFLWAIPLFDVVLLSCFGTLSFVIIFV